MDRAESHMKLPTSLGKVKDYYSSDSSSPSCKQAFRSEIEFESAKPIVMLVITTSTNNLEEEMAAMKAMLERHINESEERRHSSSCKRKRWLG